MSHRRLFSHLVAGVAALLFVIAGAVAPARAQATGRLDCQVLDSNNQPVADAVVTIDYIGDYNLSYTSKSDSKGSIVRAGLMPGRWRLTGKKGDLVGTFVATVSLGDPGRVTLVLRGGKEAAAAVAASKLSPAEIAKQNKQQKELEDTFNAAKAALDAGDLDDAIAKLKSMIDLKADCASCFAKLGDVYVQKKDNAGAEMAYKKAIELDPAQAETFNALASVYAGQKRFDEANAMSAKANALGAAAGSVNPTALYNQGVILWNQGKGEEALPLFQKAVAADPKLADAHYLMGMIYVGMDKKPEAIKSLETYLTLAPTGENAATAKAVLASIK